MSLLHRTWVRTWLTHFCQITYSFFVIICLHSLVVSLTWVRFPVTAYDYQLLLNFRLFLWINAINDNLNHNHCAVALLVSQLLLNQANKIYDQHKFSDNMLFIVAEWMLYWPLDTQLKKHAKYSKFLLACKCNWRRAES